MVRHTQETAFKFVKLDERQQLQSPAQQHKVISKRLPIININKTTF